MSFYSRIFLILSLSLLASIATHAAADTPSDLRGIGITARDSVTGTNREVKLYRQMHAVIIGIDKYQNLTPDQQLSYAVKDAKGIENVLREQYSFDNIDTLYNEQATKSGIMAILQGKLSNIHEDDAVFIFFAGHGTTQKDKLKGGELGYILPYDGTFSKDMMYINISMTQLKDEVANVIPAKHVFYVIDACYSGTLLAQRAGSAAPEHDYAYLQEVTKEPVRQVLTAGTDKQKVLDGGPKGHSVFTGRLIEKLEETEDYITAAELGEYVKRLVHSDALQRNHNQTPVSGAFYGLGDFVFVPSANKRALEMEKERKRLEEELARLKEQEKRVDAWKIQQQREEIERQQKALEAKQKIEELRQSQIAEAKRREEERLRQEQEAKSQENMRKKEEEERLAYLKTEIFQKRMQLQDQPSGQLTVEEAIERINKLKAKLPDMQAEIDKTVSEAVNQIRLDYARQLREADAGSRDEFESSEIFKKRLANAEQKKKRIQEDQAKAEDNIRVKFSMETADIRKEIDDLLNAEYPVPSSKLSFVRLGQYNADEREMQVEIYRAPYKDEIETAGYMKTEVKDERFIFSDLIINESGYLKIESEDAKLLKQHHEFLRAKGWSRIDYLQPFLSRIEIMDDADNQRAIQGKINKQVVSLGEIIMDTSTGLQWARESNRYKGTWEEANAYVRNLKLGGYSDWRLPTKEELESLLTYCTSKGIQFENGKCAEYYNKIGFKNVRSSYYWSSTSYAYDPDFAWIVYMWNGSVFYYNKSYSYYYVWPVRSGR